ncbi:MAG: flagellin [Tissierellia bacterium]|nr:flagellin [Tissierellia bacterium]
MDELDGISERTEFNTQKLLDGSFKKTFQIGANQGQTVELQLDKINSANLGLVTFNSIENGNITKKLLADGVYVLESGKLKDTAGNIVATYINDDNNKEYKIMVDSEVIITLEKAALADGAIITISDEGAKFDVKNKITVGEATKQLAPGTYEIIGDNVIKDGKLVGTFDSESKSIKINDKVITEKDLGFQDGTLGNEVKFTINGADVTTRETAEGTITAIDNAIQKVSAERSKLGAMQNRLEHTIRNLDNAAENLTAAESRIRDVDMAKEMMEFTKQTILQQAATAMLAQANQAPQSVLQLLR